MDLIQIYLQVTITTISFHFFPSNFSFIVQIVPVKNTIIQHKKFVFENFYCFVFNLFDPLSQVLHQGEEQAPGTGEHRHDRLLRRRLRH